MKSFPDNMKEIPGYPESRPLELADKPVLDAIFSSLQPRVSEFTFANLFLFRTAHRYRLTKVGETIIVLGKGYRGEPYFLPPLGAETKEALALLLNDGKTLYGADEGFAGEYLNGPDLRLTEDRDNFDYLYLRAELAELPGNRYHKKKNRVNYFTARHDYRVELFTFSHTAESLKVLEEWRRVRQELESPSIAEESAAAEEALRMAERLDLKGVVVLVDGVVKAFALGELLNRETSVCHFQKADPFLDGLYQLVDREFCRLLFTGCRYVNREQDLGERNLREAKLSYHPVELVKKFRVVLGQ